MFEGICWLHSNLYLLSGLQKKELGLMIWREDTVVVNCTIWLYVGCLYLYSQFCITLVESKARH